MDSAQIPEPQEETGAQNGSTAVAEACPPDAPNLPLPLAGLEAGIIGGLAMLALMILNSLWRQHPWWSIPNLLGSTFYSHRAFHMGAGMASASGIALHLVISGLAGVIFATVIAGPLSRTRSTLVGIAAGLLWYYATIYILYPRIGPLVVRYAPEPSTLLAYVLFGVFLGRFPYRASPGPLAAEPAGETAVDEPSEVEPRL